MMGRLFFTRHGQTVWNVENKVCGATDVALTELGHQQAITLGEQIKGLPIQEILTSPLIRARDTANHISEISGIPVRVEELLREQNFGIYEGGARDAKDFLAAKRQFINHFDGGESMARVTQRVYNLLDRIRQEDKTYLLVAHNGIARVVQSYFTDMTNEEYASYKLKNCELKIFEWEV